MAPSVPFQACFRKWSGLNCVESYLIVSSAVLKVLISAHRGDWLWVKCVLMNTNLRRGLGLSLSGICWVSESSGQVIKLVQVYQRTLGSLRDACGDAQTLRFLPGKTWSITATAMCLLLRIHVVCNTVLFIYVTCLMRSSIYRLATNTRSDPKRLDGLRAVGKHRTLNILQWLPQLFIFKYKSKIFTNQRS